MSQPAVDHGRSEDRPAGDRQAWPARWMFALGVGCVLLGGLVAAVTSPLDLTKGSWLAAYLVLVAGVAQCALSQAPRWFGVRRSSAATGVVQLLCWNLGNGAVILGVLTGVAGIVDLGGLALVVVLIIAWQATLRRQAVAVSPWGYWAYRSLLIVLIISIPVGLILAYLRTRP